MGSFLSGFLSIFAIAVLLSFQIASASEYRSPKISVISQEEAYAMIYPTAKLSPSPSPTPSPTSAPTPYQTQAPTPAPAVISASDSSDPMISQINAFRSANSLSPVFERSEVCAFANTRASEISSSFNHDGFRSRLDSKTLPYPSYSQVVENIAMNSNQSEAVNGWINSPAHAENMKKDIPFGCVGKNGNYYVYEGWKP